MSYHSNLKLVTQIRIFFDQQMANEFMADHRIIDVKFASGTPEYSNFKILVIYEDWAGGKE